MTKTIKNIVVLFVFQVVTLNLAAINTDSLINSANKLYNQGLYDSALMDYQTLLDNNIESGELYYNMGNAYYKNNDIASAILYYEKARKLLPNDDDVNYNLNIANSMIVDKIDKVPQLFYYQWWNYFTNLFSGNLWTIISLVTFAILVSFIGLFILSKTRRSRKILFYLSAFFLLITISSASLAYHNYKQIVNHDEAIVFTSSITAKSSPTQNSVDLFVIHEGTKVKVIDKINNWIEIKIQNGSTGWLPSNSVKEI